MNAPKAPIFERRATPEAGYLERKSHPLGGSVYLSRSGSIYLSAIALEGERVINGEGFAGGSAKGWPNPASVGMQVRREKGAISQWG